MACAICGKKISTIPYVAPIPITCTETKQSYIDLLADIDVQLINHPNYLIFRQTVNSQINVYDKNCGLFQVYILENIKPLII